MWDLVVWREGKKSNNVIKPEQDPEQVPEQVAVSIKPEQAAVSWHYDDLMTY